MKFFKAGQIMPDGWLKEQLQIQANGLSGSLDKVWKDIYDSAWLGGSAEGWERVPYWLDGFANELLTVCENDTNDIPFSSINPKITIKANVCKINWSYNRKYENVPRLKPKSNKAISDTETVELYPYGCAKLRMTEMSFVKD